MPKAVNIYHHWCLAFCGFTNQLKLLGKKLLNSKLNLVFNPMTNYITYN